MPKELKKEIKDEEFLYRGIVEANWDFKRKRLSSATFKDSKGVSVDRQYDREEGDCIDFLNNKKDFFAICRIKTGEVRYIGGLVKYEPLPDNVYHSEIHDSTERIQMKGSKPRKLREKSEVIYKK